MAWSVIKPQVYRVQASTVRSHHLFHWPVTNGPIGMMPVAEPPDPPKYQLPPITVATSPGPAVPRVCVRYTARHRRPGTAVKVAHRQVAIVVDSCNSRSKHRLNITDTPPSLIGIAGPQQAKPKTSNQPCTVCSIPPLTEDK